MHMHMFWHAPKLSQPSHRNPGSAMSAELSVGNVTNTAALPVVTWCSRRAGQPTHSGGQRWVHQGPQGEKKR